jgi:heterodisulfide reductase subunit C
MLSACKDKSMETILSTDLAEAIRKECSENVFLCYQCQKCSSGCPVAEHFDLAPNQVMGEIYLQQTMSGPLNYQ